MKVVFAALALAACSSPPARRASVPKPAPVDKGPTLPARKPMPPSTAPIVFAPHGALVVRLALAPDSPSVLSQDAAGGTRLWPTLDGTREPVIVSMPVGKQLALGRRDNGWIAVARDESGGLYIATLDAQGRQLGHATVGIEPAIVGVAITAHGIVAWRADHHIVLLDADGNTLADLPVEPQQRIGDLALGRDGGIAIIELGGGARRVRRLTVSPKLAWGDWIDQAEAPFAGSVIALAPDGQHYAVGDTAPKKAQVAIYDMRGGRISKGQLQASALTLAFYDNQRLAIASPEFGFGWLTTEANASVLNVTPAYPPNNQGLLVAGGSIVVSARDADLLLLTRESTQYLGYGFTSGATSERGPRGNVVLAARARALELSPSLDAAPIDLGLADASIVDFVWVGDDDYLVETSRSDATFQVALVEGHTSTRTVLRERLGSAYLLAYEPSTQMVTLSFGPRSEVARLDRKARTLASIATLTPKSTYEEIVAAPLAPDLARGNTLVQVNLRDKPMVRWIKNASTLGTAAATATLGGAYLGTDPAGRVYAWEPDKAGTLHVAVFTDGKRMDTLPTQGPARLWPDATGSRVLETSANAVTLYENGKATWSTALSGTLDALWLSDGAIAVTHLTGVVRLDPATGLVTGARCGWEFGLASQPHDPVPQIEAICAQLPR